MHGVHQAPLLLEPELVLRLSSRRDALQWTSSQAHMEELAPRSPPGEAVEAIRRRCTPQPLQVLCSVLEVQGIDLRTYHNLRTKSKTAVLASSSKRQGYASLSCVE